MAQRPMTVGELIAMLGDFSSDALVFNTAPPVIEAGQKFLVLDEDRLQVNEPDPKPYTVTVYVTLKVDALDSSNAWLAARERLLPLQESKVLASFDKVSVGEDNATAQPEPNEEASPAVLPALYSQENMQPLLDSLHALPVSGIQYARYGYGGKGTIAMPADQVEGCSYFGTQGPTINPVLEAWARDNGTYWEWVNPELLALYW
jgi:hypothetical protein